MCGVTGTLFLPKVSYIENRIAALNAAGLPVDKKRKVMTFVSFECMPEF